MTSISSTEHPHSYIGGNIHTCMDTRLVYGIGIILLVSSLIAGVVSYREMQHREDEAHALAVSTIDFAQRLHLADTEHPLHYESGELPFYEKVSHHSPHSYAHNLYQRSFAALAVGGFFLGVVLIYYASRKPDSRQQGE